MKSTARGCQNKGRKRRTIEQSCTLRLKIKKKDNSSIRKTQQKQTTRERTRSRLRLPKRLRRFSHPRREQKGLAGSDWVSPFLPIFVSGETTRGDANLELFVQAAGGEAPQRAKIRAHHEAAPLNLDTHCSFDTAKNDENAQPFR